MDRTHTPRGLRPALVATGALASLLVTSAASTAWSQARGQLIVLGLRAPQGDDTEASNASQALRVAARAAGFAVPDSSPTLEAAMAQFSCDDSVPAACLAQIAADVHADRMVYGQVVRNGRGRTAPLNVQVSLYTAADRVVRPATAIEVPRAMAMDNDALPRTLRRQIDELLPGQGTAMLAGPTPGPGGGRPAPIRRYIGFGLAGLGVAGLITGVVTGVSWLGLEGSENQPGRAWFNYQPMDNAGRYLTSGDAVCAAAARMDPDRNPNPSTFSFAGVQNVCDSARSLSTMTWAFGATGLALIGVGIVLIATDNSDAAPAADNATRRAQLSRPSVDVEPVVSPTTRGATLRLSF